MSDELDRLVKKIIEQTDPESLQAFIEFIKGLEEWGRICGKHTHMDGGVCVDDHGNICPLFPCHGVICETCKEARGKGFQRCPHYLKCYPPEVM